MRFTNRQILKIAGPILVSVLMEHLIGMTDTAFLGRVGEVELGASALAGVYYLAIFMLGFGFSTGVQIMIGRRNGEGNYTAIGELFNQGFVFQFLLATFIFFATRFGSPLLLRHLLGLILRALLTGLRHDAPRQTEIVHTPALFRAGNTVIERVPLVGDNLAADEFRFPLPERVSDGNGVEVDRVREAGGIHEGVLLYSRLIFSCWWWKPLVLNCSLRQLRGSALEGVARVF